LGKDIVLLFVKGEGMMKKKFGMLIVLLVLALALAAPVQAGLVEGLGDITATGDAGTILTITYDGDTYDTSTDLVSGTTTLYDGSDNPVASGYPAPGADDFSFDQTLHTTDGAGVTYLETIFGTTDSYDTFFVFENGGNDDASWYGKKANGDLIEGVWVDASATASATGRTTGVGGQSLKGYVFTTSEAVAGIRILPGSSLGVADTGIGFDAYSNSAVPEPATIALLALGGLVLVRRHRS
jgi:hypothetical protein